MLQIELYLETFLRWLFFQTKVGIARDQDELSEKGDRQRGRNNVFPPVGIRRDRHHHLLFPVIAPGNTGDGFVQFLYRLCAFTHVFCAAKTQFILKSIAFMANARLGFSLSDYTLRTSSSCDSNHRRPFSDFYVENTRLVTLP